MLSPDTSALILLCSIFDWTMSGKSVGRRQLPVKVRVKPALLSHWKQPFPFSLFSSFLYFQTCFFLPCSLLFFRLWCSHTVWDCHSQRTRTKTVYRLFVLVFRLNFPCKYVVSGCFPFQLFFPICSFFFWKQRENKGQTADRTGSEKPENKKQKYPDCLVLILLLMFTLFYFRPDSECEAGRKITLPLCPFTLRSYFIQKPFTQTTLFLHVYAIYFNHSKQQELLPQKRLQDFFHNTRADKNLSALLPFLILFSRRRIIHGMVCFFVYPGSGA